MVLSAHAPLPTSTAPPSGFATQERPRGVGTAAIRNKLLEGFFSPPLPLMNKIGFFGIE